jgi:23S rRNA pseudouridine1911/1915/1917 synthase
MVDGPGSIEHVVGAALDGERVDRAVALLAGISRKASRQLAESGAIAIDGRRPASAATVLRAGEVLVVDAAGLAEVKGRQGAALRPDPSVAFQVVYEDRHIIVVDKPAGLVVHQGAGNERATLVDGLLARFFDLAAMAELPHGAGRPGIVHRLDKGTSGLLVVARSQEALEALSSQFRAHTARRSYIALVEGIIAEDAGVIEAPIARSSRDPTKMAVVAAGRFARTSYTVRERFYSPFESTLVEASLETGRTHQVRVHFAAIGHPLVGDGRYGSRDRASRGSLPEERVFLHAWRLEIEHPEGGRMAWSSPLPSDLQDLLTTLRRSSGSGD